MSRWISVQWPIFVTDIYVQRDWECAADRSSESLTLSERGGKWEVPRLRHGCRCPSPARTSSNTNSPTFPALVDDRFENGGLPVQLQLVLYQQTLVLYRIFTKTLREECSGGVRRRTWVRFGLRQPVKKTTSTCDNLVWLTCTRRVHPA